MANEVVVNSADFKFADFTSDIGLIPNNFHDKDWYIKLREIDAKLHIDNLHDKITFSDDRLVLIAYRLMIETGMFDKSAKLREWWIVYRYLTIYATGVKMIEELRKVVNMYIGYSFSGAQMDTEQTTEFKSLTKALSETVYEDGYIQLPEFVLDVINDGNVEREEESKEEVQEDVVEYVLSDNERTEWENLRDTSAMMLTGELTEEEKTEWFNLLNVATMMLGD